MVQTHPRPTTELSIFDYADLDAENRKVLQQHANEIKAHLRDAAESVWEIGRKLADARERLRNEKYGQFGAWLKHEFPPKFSRSKAYSYIKVYKFFPTRPDFGQVEIADSALTLWASSAMPEAAREELSARAEAGERITFSLAEDARLRHTTLVSKEELEEDYSPAIAPELEDLQEDRHLDEVLPQGFQGQPYSSQTTHSTTSVNRDSVQIPSRSQPGTIARPNRRKRSREDKPLVVAPKQVQPGEWWKLGKDNYLYCGDPNSAEFQKLLPETIHLSVAFPPTAHWQLDFLSSKSLSSFALHTVYEKDQDLSLLRQAIEQLLQIYTEGADETYPGDIVVLSFLPDPAVLPLIKQMDCRFLCADPDPKRCDEVITVWTSMKQTAEKMKANKAGKKRLLSSVSVR